MANNQNQLRLFNKQTTVLDLPNADVRYTPLFYSPDEAGDLFQRILDETNWRQETITVYGRQHLTPRLTCWMGDDGLDYRYSGMTMTPMPWSDCLRRVKTKLERSTSTRYNSVLINYYRDGRDSNGWHSDDEPELGRDPVIASISLGAGRDFQLRHKDRTSLKYSLCLENGSLLVMQGATQRYWQHQIPKRAVAGGRINLTFRTVVHPRSE